MVEVRHHNPHDPLPEGGRTVIVLHRMDEDDPRLTVTQIMLTGRPGQGETVHPVRADGTPMNLDQAVEAAKLVAKSEGLDVVHLVDRTTGPREKEVLAHDGDHTVNMASLDDTDMEEGERGSDMRDRGH